MRVLKSVFEASPQRPKTGSLEEATFRRAVRATRRTFGAEHVNVALSHIELGDFYVAESRFDESETAYRKAAEIYEALGIGHELLLAIALRSLSDAVCAQDRHQEGNAIRARSTQLILNFQ
jgi:hypothetical protein